MDKQGFEPFTRALNRAGVETGSGRGFWGGVTANDEVVATVWLDEAMRDGQFPIHRPPYRHGGLLDAWELGRVREGAAIKVIQCRRKTYPDGKVGVQSARVTPGWWRVTFVSDDGKRAIVEKIGSGQQLAA